MQWLLIPQTFLVLFVRHASRQVASEAVPAETGILDWPGREFASLPNAAPSSPGLLCLMSGSDLIPFIPFTHYCGRKNTSKNIHKTHSRPLDSFRPLLWPVVQPLRTSGFWITELCHHEMEGLGSIPLKTHGKFASATAPAEVKHVCVGRCLVDCT